MIIDKWELLYGYHKEVARSVRPRIKNPEYKGTKQRNKPLITNVKHEIFFNY